MRKKTLFIGGALVLLMAAALFESITHIGRGWWRGEPFYHHLPASWWSAELGRWRYPHPFC